MTNSVWMSPHATVRRHRYHSIGGVGCVRYCGSITSNKNLTNSMNVSLDFNAGIHEKHSALPGKYEFSFTIACKYLNSGKSEKRPPAPSPSSISSSTKRHTVFPAVFPAFDLSHHNGKVCASRKLEDRTDSKRSDEKDRLLLLFLFAKINSVPTRQWQWQCHKERMSAQDDGDEVKVNRTFEAYGLANVMVTDDIDVPHNEKWNRQKSRAHDADTPKWARVRQTKKKNGERVHALRRDENKLIKWSCKTLIRLEDSW